MRRQAGINNEAGFARLPQSYFSDLGSLRALHTVHTLPIRIWRNPSFKCTGSLNRSDLREVDLIHPLLGLQRLSYHDHHSE